MLQDRRVQQQVQATHKENETSEKIAARAFAQSYLADLVPSVFGMLSDNGYFYDPVERGNHLINIYKRFNIHIHVPVQSVLHNSH